MSQALTLEFERTLPAPRERVFETIRDPKSFIALVDGLRDLKEIDPTHYEAVFETKIAYMKFRFNVSVEVTKLEIGEIGAKVEGTPLGVVLIPDEFQVEEHVWQDVLADAGGIALERDRPQRVITAWLER